MSETSSLIAPEGTASDVDVSVFKLVTFVILTSIAAAVCGYFIASVTSTWSLVWQIAALSVFWLMFTLQGFFIKSRTRAVVSIAFESLMMILPVLIIFWSSVSIYFFIAYAVLFGALYFAYDGARAELKNAIKIPFWRITHKILAKAVPGTIIFIFIVYAFIAGKAIVQGQGDVFTRYILVPIVRIYIPEFNDTMTINDLLQKIAERQIGSERYAELPQTERNNALQKTNDFIRSYAEIKTNVPIGNAIYDFFANKLQSSDWFVKFYIGLTLLALVWFIIKAVALVFYLPLGAVTFLIFEILIAANFIVIQYEAKSREVVLLK